MNPIANKGIYSSEFWLTALTAAGAIFASSGLLPTDEANMVSSSIIKVALTLSNAAQTIYYIYSRHALKTTQAKLIAENPDFCTVCGKAMAKDGI